jgi:hypothetical protein
VLSIDLEILTKIFKVKIVWEQLFAKVLVGLGRNAELERHVESRPVRDSAYQKILDLKG